MTVQQITGPAVCGFIAGGFVAVLEFDLFWAVTTAAVGLVLGLLNALLLDKSWKQGMDQAEMDARFQATREMTRETFGPSDRREH